MLLMAEGKGVEMAKKKGVESISAQHFCTITEAASSGTNRQEGRKEKERVSEGGENL